MCLLTGRIEKPMPISRMVRGLEVFIPQLAARVERDFILLYQLLSAGVPIALYVLLGNLDLVVNQSVVEHV